MPNLHALDRATHEGDRPDLKNAFGIAVLASQTR